MRIIQMLPTIIRGDAVSNNAIALKHAIVAMGYSTEIYAENIDVRLPRRTARSIKDLPRLNNRDIVLYHLSTGTALNDLVATINGKKVIIYHNITKPCFFSGYNTAAEKRCENGLAGAKKLASIADYALADSKYNKKDLEAMGYCCPIDVLPILIEFKDYLKKPNKALLKKYNDDWTNIIFTGRIAPNKKQEDIIASFYYYKKINPKSRLFLIGANEGMETYDLRLKEYVRLLELEDVHFTGHIGFDEILAYYKLADAFVCMSEHEGFCVPLVEAMFFDVPVIAYDSSAVGDTLGGSGFLVDDKDPRVVAGVIDRIVKDRNLRENILFNQRLRLKDFEHEKILDQFRVYLKGLL